MGYIKKEVNRKVGKAIHQFGLLNQGDSIMVAVSGGTDSLAMLHFLAKWQKKAPIDFHLIPVYLEMGFNKATCWPLLKAVFENLNLPYYMEETSIGLYAHSDENRGKSPCFICAWRRRKRLFELTQILGCNKIALGHTLDDVIETFFLNMCYSGEMSTMLPRQVMFNGLVTIIRPLTLVEKSALQRLSPLLGITSCANLCPSAKVSKRSHIRKTLGFIYNQDKKIKGNIARAIFNIRKEYLP